MEQQDMFNSKQGTSPLTGLTTTVLRGLLDTLSKADFALNGNEVHQFGKFLEVAEKLTGNFEEGKFAVIQVGLTKEGTTDGPSSDNDAASTDSTDGQ